MYDRPRARLVTNLLRGGALLLALACLALLLASRGLHLQFTTPALPGVPRVATATRTPTESPTRTPSATQAPSATTSRTATSTPVPNKQYTVVEGDSLFSIALENGLTIQQLAVANNKVDDRLAIGEVLIIPPPEYELPTATPFPPGLVTGTPLEHVIAPGETLAQIARAYMTTVEFIVRDNKNIITDPDHPPVGATIVVRYGLVTATPLAPTTTETPGS